MFNLHLPSIAGTSVVFIVAIILLYFLSKRMLKFRSDRLARTGRMGDERGDPREMSALYTAPHVNPSYNPNSPMTLHNPCPPSWLQGWRSSFAPVSQLSLQPPAVLPDIAQIAREVQRDHQNNAYNPNNPLVPARDAQLEELARQHDMQRDHQSNAAIRMALSADERRANSLIQSSTSP